MLYTEDIIAKSSEGNISNTHKETSFKISENVTSRCDYEKVPFLTCQELVFVVIHYRLEDASSRTILIMIILLPNCLHQKFLI